MDQTALTGQHPDTGRLGRRHHSLHRPDHRRRARVRARRPVHPAGLRRSARAWRPRRRLHGRRRRGPAHGAVPRAPRHHLPAGDHGDRTRGRPAPRDGGYRQGDARSQGPGARIIGAHLEGPFISPDALGAQPPFAIPPDLPLLEELAALAPIRVATYAPEIDPAGELLAAFRRLGTRAQIGHTTCTYAQARAALAAGAAGFTHLFNAMSGLHHRRAGAVGAALALAQSAELILDLHHVEEGAALAALRAIPRLHCVTDAVAAAGMPDGEYHLGAHTIVKRGDIVRLADGSLAGSVLTMDRALRNLLRLGLPLAEAARRCSTLPADYLGLADRGQLVPGAAADLVVVDRLGQIGSVLNEGRA